jgi:hypothetical protein
VTESDPWDTGELGRSLEHAVLVDDEYSETTTIGTIMTDATLLDIAERIATTKAEMDLAENGVRYYQRVLVAAEVRYEEKRQAFAAALADMKGKGRF